MKYEGYIKHKISFGLLSLFTLCAGVLTSASGQTSLAARPSAADISNAVSGRDAIARREAATESMKAEQYPSNVTALAPSNDLFQNAEVISGSSSVIGGTNVDADIEPGEPQSCAGCKTVWYRWTAPADLSMTFETYGGQLTDTVLDVYMGKTVSSLKMLVANDNITPNTNSHSRVTFAATAGTTYNIRLYGSNGVAGTFNLRWEINGADSWKQFNFDGAAGSMASD